MSEKNNNSSWFVLALTLIFIALKLMGYITWSWVWVLSPIWIPIALVIFVGIIGAIVKTLKQSKDYNKSKNWMDEHENEELLHQMWTGEKDD